MKLAVKITMPVTNYQGKYDTIGGTGYPVLGHDFFEKNFENHGMDDNALVNLTRLRIPCTCSSEAVATGVSTVDPSKKTVFFEGFHDCRQNSDTVRNAFNRDGWKYTHRKKQNS